MRSFAGIESEFGPDFGEECFLMGVGGVISGQDPALPLAVGQPDDDTILKVMLLFASLFEPGPTAWISVVIADQEDPVKGSPGILPLQQSQGSLGGMGIGFRRFRGMAAEMPMGSDAGLPGQILDILPEEIRARPIQPTP